MSRLRPLSDPDRLPALDKAYLSAEPAAGLGPNNHPPRILLLYGSLFLAATERLRRSLARSSPSQPSSAPSSVPSRAVLPAG